MARLTVGRCDSLSREVVNMTFKQPWGPRVLVMRATEKEATAAPGSITFLLQSRLDLTRSNEIRWGHTKSHRQQHL